MYNFNICKNYISRLLNELNNGISAPAIGFGDVGHNGFVDYNDVCAFLRSSDVLPIFDDVSKSPYVTYEQQWISFDNTESLTFKVI